MENVIIRTATLDDLDTLLRFEQGVIAAERPFAPTLKEDPVHYYDLPFMIDAAHIHLVVAVQGDTIVGSGYARIDTSRHFYRHPQHVYLGFMYVVPEHRGKGINQQIIRELEAWSRSRGIAEMRLEVFYDNAPAIQAYCKAGFDKYMIEMRRGL